MRGSSSTPVQGGDDITTLLGLVVEDVEAAVYEAVADAQEARLEALRTEAAQHPLWEPLSASLEAWENEEGHWTVGVPDDAPGAAEAAVAEYGSESSPPTALVRRVAFGAWGMKQHIDTRLREQGY